MRLKLKGEPFTLVINAITGIKTVVETMRYICKLKTRYGNVPIVLYGIDEITSIVDCVSTDKLVKLFPDFSAKQLERPGKCDLLLSQANASLMPSKRCTVDNLVLWDGPFGIVVSGTHNDLRETYVNHV